MTRISMSDLHAEFAEMSTEALERAFWALKCSPNKSLTDEAIQEFMAQELDRRELEEDCCIHATGMN